ncbi:pectin lyase fold/virulence factor [Rhexocercosporidium sp. MPI-PUGE-AT-0058]|nr:pectin lyase fold/virulence factor [Rhexocercosporidium sp. MPI-PUGE-AT-0058]
MARVAQAELTIYTGPAPNLPPNRSTFSFGSLATGGSAANASSIFLVDNMPDLRTALELPYPRVVYVKGNITGHQITSDVANGSTYADCQWFTEKSGAKQFNLTRYIMSLNTSYMDGVKLAADRNETFEGMNAVEFLTLLKKMNGWRPQAQNSQKAWVSINVKSDLTLIGVDENALLNGVSLIFNTVNNVIIRNLKMIPPQDCFPAPETVTPDTAWNARYDALSLVTSTNFWIDGNTLQDGPARVAPDPLIWGYKVDRYDGLMDCEDGSDNITFSHNIVGNHHKSLLLGGGLKERGRDLGKMRFMFFGNWFSNSDSRNPLMRFGTFYILNNLFTYENVPVGEYQGQLQYNLGIYTECSVLADGNVFQNAEEKNTTKIFSFSTLVNTTLPARLCIPASEHNSSGESRGIGSSFNGRQIDLEENALATFNRFVIERPDNVVNGTLLLGCQGFSSQSVPVAFQTTEEVEAYVRKEAGQRASG